MRQILLCALLAASPQSVHAQRVAAVDVTILSSSASAAMASRGPVPSDRAELADRATTAGSRRDARGSVWRWVAAGALAGSVAGGALMNAHCAQQPASCAEFSIPLVTVLSGIGGGTVGALAFHFAHARQPRAMDARLTPDKR